jgi:ABC-type branched-subunit amino acid transport system ATPase component
MLLEVKDLNTYYGESHVLQDMSVAVRDGEIVALLGRNGMGKTTTLKSVMGRYFALQDSQGGCRFCARRSAYFSKSIRPG